MGILGLNMAVPFSDRLFNSFDLDNDGLVPPHAFPQINFADFVEYMDILRNGSFRSKSYLSFRMIDLQRSGIIRKKDFVGFLGDLLRAWATITNAPLCTKFGRA
jgi:Ca2+-binding EF-hand superfamily protein